MTQVFRQGWPGKQPAPAWQTMVTKPANTCRLPLGCCMHLKRHDFFFVNINKMLSPNKALTERQLLFAN